MRRIGHAGQFAASSVPVDVPEWLPNQDSNHVLADKQAVSRRSSANANSLALAPRAHIHLLLPT